MWPGHDWPKKSYDWPKKGDDKVNISKKKIIFTIILIFLILFSFGMINSYGFDVNDLKGEKFNSPSATTFANQLITVLSVIGSVLSVIVLIVLGIKYMMY